MPINVPHFPNPTNPELYAAVALVNSYAAKPLVVYNECEECHAGYPLQVQELWHSKLCPTHRALSDAERCRERARNAYTRRRTARLQAQNDTASESSAQAD